MQKTLAHWRTDPDLVGLRESEALDQLSAHERKECLTLWNEVGALFQRAQKVK